MAVNKKRIKALPDPTIPAFQKQINLICFICAVIVPIISNFVLSLIMVKIEGDIFYTTEYTLLKGFTTALNTVNMFVLFGALVNSLVRFGFQKSKTPLLFGILRIVLIYVSYIAIGAIETPVGILDIISQNFELFATNAGVDLMLLAGVIGLTLFLRSKYLNENKTNITIKNFFDLKNPLIAITCWVVLLIFAFYLSGCVTETVTALKFGVGYEAMDIIKPYLSLIGKIIVGYAIMVGCAKWFDFLWKCLHTSK